MASTSPIPKRGLDDLYANPQGGEEGSQNDTALSSHKKICVNRASENGNDLGLVLRPELEPTDIGNLQAAIKPIVNDEPTSGTIPEEGTRRVFTEEEVEVHEHQIDINSIGEQKSEEGQEVSKDKESHPQVGESLKELRRPRYAHHSIIINKLNSRITALNGSVMSAGNMDCLLRMTKVLDEIYREKMSRKSTTPTSRNFPLTKKEVLRLLDGEEEDKHPWKVTDTTKVPGDGSLWRVWDYASQSQILDKDRGLLAARSTTQGELNSWEGRNTTMELHSSWKNRQLTPYISCSSNLQSMHWRILHSRERTAKALPAQATWLTLINSNVRIREGWPVLNAIEEIRHYKVRLDALPDRYEHEYRLLWQAMPKEIVWNFRMQDIDEWMSDKKMGLDKWEKIVAEPLHAKHEELSKVGAGQAEITRALLEVLKVSMPTAEPYFK